MGHGRRRQAYHQATYPGAVLQLRNQDEHAGACRRCVSIRGCGCGCVSMYVSASAISDHPPTKHRPRSAYRRFGPCSSISNSHAHAPTEDMPNEARARPAKVFWIWWPTSTSTPPPTKRPWPAPNCPVAAPAAMRPPPMRMATPPECVGLCVCDGVARRAIRTYVVLNHEPALAGPLRHLQSSSPCLLTYPARPPHCPR